MKTKIYKLFLCCFVPVQLSCAQTNNQVKGLLFDELTWNVQDSEGTPKPMDTIVYDGKLALHLPKGHNAYLKNIKLENFEIEFDFIGFSMPGLGFRGQDKDNHELIYFRKIASGREDALQYIPIFNGSLPWQLYNYPKYERNAVFAEKKLASFPLTIENYFEQGPIGDSLRYEMGKRGVKYSSEAQLYFINEDVRAIDDMGQLTAGLFRKTKASWELWDPLVWSHVKIIVVENQAIVYVEDMELPKMTIDLKRDIVSGEISLRSQFYDAFYANISVKDLNDTILAMKKDNTRMLSDTYLRTWQLSPKFVKNENEALFQLDSLKSSGATWKKIQADEDGLINMSRFVNKMSGSVVLKTSIDSKDGQNVKMHFGFAKYLMIILNDKVVFSGEMDTKEKEGRVFVDDETVDLELIKGKNEIFLVSTGDEQYHQNWGLIAKLENLNGIKID
ncbi:hypothetical protein SAMN04487891_103433 [Flagellimonas taeanensis]|uniref:Uncharacterized protein n=1 Tax=Flagellimonas taeanensis TaxID=1005926 RepID=A0A1M6U186_9FLAO|nr:hypothetical protein [Allomuricauda taeanensis]SFB91768.1 hypothetical protein SAMN04487891_103433 [Allomuricauda taeanensis]SHK62921.1 hypothetical protein SAMN05216293_1591 [Allomuricauda taeanensis]